MIRVGTFHDRSPAIAVLCPSGARTHKLEPFSSSANILAEVLQVTRAEQTQDRDHCEESRAAFEEWGEARDLFFLLSAARHHRQLVRGVGIGSNQMARKRAANLALAVALTMASRKRIQSGCQEFEELLDEVWRRGQLQTTQWRRGNTGPSHRPAVQASPVPGAGARPAMRQPGLPPPQTQAQTQAQTQVQSPAVCEAPLKRAKTETPGRASNSGVRNGPGRQVEAALRPSEGPEGPMSREQKGHRLCAQEEDCRGYANTLLVQHLAPEGLGDVYCIECWRILRASNRNLEAVEFSEEKAEEVEVEVEQGNSEPDEALLEAENLQPADEEEAQEEEQEKVLEEAMEEALEEEQEEVLEEAMEEVQDAEEAEEVEQAEADSQDEVELEPELPETAEELQEEFLEEPPEERAEERPEEPPKPAARFDVFGSRKSSLRR